MIVEGEFSFDVSYDVTSNPPIISINGMFASKSGYFDSITSLENERYFLGGVTVTEESFGSEEDTMLYKFSAKTFAMANELRKVKINEQ